MGEGDAAARVRSDKKTVGNRIFGFLMSRYRIRRMRIVLGESEKCGPRWGLIYVFFLILSLSLIYEPLQDSSLRGKDRCPADHLQISLSQSPLSMV